MDCLFCAIINKKIPADIVYEDDRVVVFNDINPQAPHHLLTIPKKHISTINEIEASDNDLIGHMVHTAKTIAAQHGFADDGFRLSFNCNDLGGQTVYHIHLHMLAGRQMTWPPG